jgi:RNA methyltransferase, TrmH family
VKPLTSRDNSRFKELVRLSRNARERKKSGLALLDGMHLVSAYIESGGLPEQVIVSKSGVEHPEIRALLDTMKRTSPLIVSDALLKEISPVATPTGIVAVINAPRVALATGTHSCVMLENIQDPGNVGSILRSAAAAGLRHVYLSDGCADAWSPRVLRAGMGAHFRLDLHEASGLVECARRFHGTVIATAGDADTSIFEADLTGDVALLFGNEGAGLTPAVRACAAATVRIPMPGVAESLNVAAAAAVCLFERVRQTGGRR